MKVNKLKETLIHMLESYDEKTFNSSINRMRRGIEKGSIQEYKGVSVETFDNLVEDVLVENSKPIEEKGENFDYLLESVFDPIQHTRSEHIFDSEERMLDKTRKFIFDILEEWKKSFEPDIKFNVKEVNMIGSMTGFQYMHNADIDVNIWTDIKDDDVLLQLRRRMPSGYYLEGTDHPISFWVGGVNDKYDIKNAENMYDVTANKWVKKTDKKDIKVPYPYVLELSKFFMNGYDLILGDLRRNIEELDMYMSYDKGRQHIDEEEIESRIYTTLNSIRGNADSLRMGRHILRSFMVEGYESKYPFKVLINYEHEDPRYSMNNMVYKMVDKFGYFEKISREVKDALALVRKTESDLKKRRSADDNRTKMKDIQG